MNKKNGFLMKSAFLYVIATVIGQGATLAGMVVFTRVMDQTDYGMYSTYYSVVSFMVVLVGANLYFPINNAYIDFKNDFTAYRKSVLGLATVVFFIVSAVTLAWKWIFLPAVPWALAVLALFHAFAFFVINYQIYSANIQNDYPKKTILLILPYVLQFLIGLLFVRLSGHDPVAARALGSMLGVMVCAAACYISIMRFPGELKNTRYWKYALKISVPSMLMSLSYMIMQQCDKIMITDICGADETAVYSVIYYIGFAITAVNQAVSAVWLSWAYRKLDKREYGALKKVQKWYMLFAGIMVAGALMLAPEVIRIISPPPYWQFEYIAPFVLSSCMMILYGFYTSVGLFYKDSGKIALCVFVSAMVNVGLNALLIPRFGGVAACYTTVVAYGLLFATSAYVVSRRVKDLFSMPIFMGFILLSAVLCAAYWFVLRAVWLRYGLYAFLIGAALLYAYRNRNAIIQEMKG